MTTITAVVAGTAMAQLVPGQWPAEKAWEWYQRQPARVGINYVPSTACNDVEFWQAETFDSATIDRELGWAENTGFDTCRVFVNFVVWEADQDGLLERFGRFLDLAASHGICVMPVLFDDCAFGDMEPAVGKQPELTPGVHNSCWVPSPSATLVTTPALWGPLEAYVRGLVGAYGTDERVIVWDLYNEPGNSGLGEASLPLVEAAFEWARAEQPSQPLTIGAWGGSAVVDHRLVDLSDVTSFHRYGDIDSLRGAIEHYRQFGRPVICTEWMARTMGSRWDTDLPILIAEGVWSYSWGLVNGRTQTRFPWGSPRGGPEPEVWFHDLFHADGRPYDEQEIEAITAACRSRR